MITFGEAREFLLTLTLLSAIGLFPFSVDLKKGKLVKLPGWRYGIWWCSILLSIAYYTHAAYRAFVLFVLEDGVGVSRSMYILNMVVLIMATTYLISCVHTTVAKTAIVLLIFNELFQKASLDRRPWIKTPLTDTILRTFCPVMIASVMSSWSTIITVHPELPVRAINNPALSGFKTSDTLMTLNFVLDLYACGVKLYYFQALVHLYFLTCEKAVEEANKATKLLNLSIISSRSVAKALKSSRWVQLYLLVANMVNSSTVLAFKLVYITCSIGSSLNGIRSGNNAFFRVCSGIFAFLCIGGYNVTCMFANRVVAQNKILHERLTLAVSSPTIDTNLKRETRAEIRSTPLVAVRFGRFHAVERESFLIFINFVVDQVVALLIVS